MEQPSGAILGILPKDTSTSRIYTTNFLNIGRPALFSELHPPPSDVKVIIILTYACEIWH